MAEFVDSGGKLPAWMVIVVCIEVLVEKRLEGMHWYSHVKGNF